MAKPVSVLLVDDNLAFLRSATFFLEQCGEMIVVGAVADGQEALDRVYDLDPDVVLLDLVMPEMTGWQIIARLRAERPEIGTIAMSVWDIDSYRQAARGRRGRVCVQGRDQHRIVAGDPACAATSPESAQNKSGAGDGGNDALAG